jgi:RNA polymerase sigma-70 factor, ECF subfamily
MSGLSQPSSPAQPPSADADAQRVAALVARARAGDRSAYGQIVLLYQDRLYNALLRMVGETEEARELTQETFARGLENLETFRGDSGPYTWLFRIGMNLAISQVRKSQRRRTFSLDAGAGGNGHRAADLGDGQAASLVDRIASTEAQPHQNLEKREQAQIVLDALGRLDPEYRAVLVMRDIEEMDYRQMADVLEMPLGTLKSRLFRARLALRDELATYMSSGRRK